MAEWRNYGVERMNIGVIGAGIAGLAVALGLERAGHQVTIFEAEDTIGGRMRTVEHEGQQYDLGFHVLHTAYPTVQRWIDLDALEAKPMDSCTVSIDPSTGRRRVLGDALRAPKYLLPTLKAVGVRDGLRFLKWRLSTSASDLERPLDRPSATVEHGLRKRRFRPSTRRVLGPLFAGITLDPTLSERFSFAEFTWGAMSHGSMVVPKNGIGAVPQQLADQLERTHIRLSTKVVDVSATSVTTAHQTHAFDHVVLATPQHVTSALLPNAKPVHTPTERLTSTVAFMAPRSPYSQARLLLNEGWGSQGRDVLHVHIPTNLHPRSDGQEVIIATLVGDAAQRPEPDKVLGELRQWFGEQVDRWSYAYTTTVRHALPHTDPNHHQRRVNNLTVDGVFIVGDHRAHPSVQGALASAEHLLQHLNIPLPMK